MPYVDLTDDSKMPQFLSLGPKSFQGASGLATPIFFLSSLEPKSLRMVFLTIILVQVLCCLYQSPKHYIEIWHERPFSLQLHHHNLGEEPKEATRELRRRHQRCATPNVMARCRPERQPELLHHGTIPLKPHTHDRRSPCPSGASVEHSCRSAEENH